MGTFKVTMLDKTGKEHNRSICADMSEEMLMESLLEKGYYPLRIERGQASDRDESLDAIANTIRRTFDFDALKRLTDRLLSGDDSAYSESIQMLENGIAYISEENDERALLDKTYLDAVLQMYKGAGNPERTRAVIRQNMEENERRKERIAGGDANAIEEGKIVTLCRGRLKDVPAGSSGEIVLTEEYLFLMENHPPKCARMICRTAEITSLQVRGMFTKILRITRMSGESVTIVLDMKAMSREEFKRLGRTNTMIKAFCGAPIRKKILRRELSTELKSISVIWMMLGKLRKVHVLLVFCCAVWGTTLTLGGQYLGRNQFSLIRTAPAPVLLTVYFILMGLPYLIYHILSGKHRGVSLALNEISLRLFWGAVLSFICMFPILILLVVAGVVE